MTVTILAVRHFHTVEFNTLKSYLIAMSIAWSVKIVHLVLDSLIGNLATNRKNQNKQQHQLLMVDCYDAVKPLTTIYSYFLVIIYSFKF